MKLHDRKKGDRVSVRERVQTDGIKKVNVYDLLVHLGKGKARAEIVRIRIEAAIKSIVENAERLSFPQGHARAFKPCEKCGEFGPRHARYSHSYEPGGEHLRWTCGCGYAFESECAA